MKTRERILIVSVVFDAMLVLLCSGVSTAQSTNDTQILSVEPRVLNANSQGETLALVNRAEIYPKEIYFGDTIFFLAYSRNVTEHAIENLERLSYGTQDEYIHFICPSVSAEVYYKEQSYSLLHEFPVYGGGLMFGCHPSTEITIQPNEECIVVRGFFELPTLREQGENFWQEVLKDLETQESVTVTLKVQYGNFLGATPYHLFLEASFEVIIKARTKSEQKLLDQWRLTTPWNKVLVGSEDSPTTSDTKRAEIPIGSNSYSPWTFIRVGNRKPSDPNNPTNVSGWRELETMFQPGVLRDDIVFTRMQLEYYTLRNKKDFDAKRKAFIAWINLKPRPQRAVYLGVVLAGRLAYHDGIKERYIELCKAASAAYVKLENEVRASSIVQSVDPSE